MMNEQALINAGRNRSREWTGHAASVSRSPEEFHAHIYVIRRAAINFFAQMVYRAGLEQGAHFDDTIAGIIKEIRDEATLLTAEFNAAVSPLVKKDKQMEFDFPNGPNGGGVA